jgi:GTP cyclohydrolase II
VLREWTRVISRTRRAGRNLIHSQNPGAATCLAGTGIDYGDFELHLYRSTTDGQHHLALVKGDL